jgi:hypothetical protein
MHYRSLWMHLQVSVDALTGLCGCTTGLCGCTYRSLWMHYRSLWMHLQVSVDALQVSVDALTGLCGCTTGLCGELDKCLKRGWRIKRKVWIFNIIFYYFQKTLN